jgi:hypothetical protein
MAPSAPGPDKEEDSLLACMGLAALSSHSAQRGGAVIGECDGATIGECDGVRAGES